MRKRYLPIAVLLGLSALAALAGYLVTPDRSGHARILLPNTAGRVVFTHDTHAQDYKIACTRCHHEQGGVPAEAAKGQGAMLCASCHGVRIDAEFVETHVERYAKNGGDKSCVTCHHVEFAGLASGWDHDTHKDDYASGDCQTCHHTPDIEPEPQKCSNCHSPAKPGPDFKAVSRIGLSKAAHEKCLPCHEAAFEEKLEGCATCHDSVQTRERLAAGSLDKKFSACASCHEGVEAEALIPGRMDAFHKQCMGCHESVKKGPYSKEQCKQCHN